MEQVVHGIVLKRADSGESDRRLTLFTAEAGKIDVIAKGARKGASRLGGSSEPLIIANMNLAKSKKNFYVTQAQPLRSFKKLRTDYDRLIAALALAELYAMVLPYEQPDEDLYDLLIKSLSTLEEHKKPAVALVWCELKLFSVSGFLPTFDRCAVSDAKIAEATPFLSPWAGGYVCLAEAQKYSDRFKTRAEVLYGITKVLELDEAPENLKFAEETLAAMLPFWREVAGRPLAANETCIGEFRHGN